MRSDVLSQRLFYAGCCGLPWLWLAHVLYHWNLDELPVEASTINPDDHFDADMNQEQVQRNTQKWMRYHQMGAGVGMACFFGWIVIAQILRGSSIPNAFYMLNSDDAELTGW